MIDWIQNIEFEHPWFLLIIGIIPVLILGRIKWTSRRQYDFPVPTLKGIGSYKTFRYHLNLFLPYLRYLALILFIIALARPRLPLKEETVNAEGIDIMMVLDLSSSMLSRDFKPNRLEASKKVASEFILNRTYDRIGLTVFSAESFTMCPLTGDHEVLIDMMDDVEAGILEDGTAIGNGLSTAVNRLKDSDSKSRVAILLTDGVNNRGYIDPELAIQIAREFNIKVYTIGVGTNGLAQSPIGKNLRGDYIYDYVRVNIDENLLREIARETGGLYFRAKDETELQQVYNEIDALEKTKVELNVFKRYSEEFEWFVLFGFGLFLLEILLRFTILKTMPA
jgi:Ca-activated chloride channel family protein